jgi:hypothetical protein
MRPGFMPGNVFFIAGGIVFAAEKQTGKQQETNRKSEIV